MTSWPSARCLTRLDKILDHRQRHIGLQQRHAHLAQRVLDIFFGESGFAGNTAQALGQAITQALKHGLHSLADRYTFAIDYAGQVGTKVRSIL